MTNFDAAVHFSILYFSIVLITCIFGAFTRMTPNKRLIYLVIVFSILCVIMAFRNYSMGNDTQNYVIYFKRVAKTSSPFEYLSYTNMEPLYIIYNWLLSRIWNNPRILFIVTSIFECYTIGRFVYKYSDNPGIFCCIFLGFLQFDFYLSAMRQGISICILLYAFDYLMQKRRTTYFILNIIAIFFHYSSIIFLLLYPLYLFSSQPQTRKLRSSFNTLLLVITVVCCLFFDKIFFFLFALFPKYYYYDVSTMLSSAPPLAIFLKILIYTLLFAVPSIIKNEYIKESSILNTTFRNLIKVNLAILAIATNATLFTRFSDAFSLYTIMYYSHEIEQKFLRDRQILIYATVMAFFLHGLVVVIFRTPDWQTTYPISLQI